MTFQERQKELTDKIVASLLRIKRHPEGWLPHTVFVEEEGTNGHSEGVPVYTQYQLMGYLPDGNCLLSNSETGQLEHDDYHLSAINLDWLVTVWNRYAELSAEQDIPAIPEEPEKKLWAFVWNFRHMDRNATDEEILAAWENGPSRSSDKEDEREYEVEKLTPDELSERINDDGYAHATDYVRFIYTDK